ncbi:MAG TPA: MFS transporter [Candidatus Dormibacteraeota bacterium]
MQPLRGLTWAGTIYHVGVILAGAALVPVSLILFPVHERAIPQLLYLAVFTQLAALLPIRWRRGTQTLDTMPLIAVSLLAPGAGVALVAWLCMFDGRRPSPQLELWKLIFIRAKAALEFGLPSMLITLLPLSGIVDVPVRTVLLASGSLLIGFPLMAAGFALYGRETFWSVFTTNVGFSSIRSVVILAIGGGALYMLLQMPAGYLMGIGLLGLLMAVRSNMADAQRQQIERIQTLELLAQALDARDPMTELHSQRVSDLASRLAEVLGMSSLEIERMRVAGLLHDIGKIGVPDSVLKKAGQLDASEWSAMRRHADLGADMIARHTALEPIAPWVRTHHERWNGSGYPKSMSGEYIPLGGRILAVADSYDTITGPRVYRPSVLTPLEAVNEISRSAGTLYDPVVVDALRKLHGLPALEPLAPDGRLAAREVTAGFGLLRNSYRFRMLALGMTASSLGDPLTAIAIVVTAYALMHSALAVAATYALRALAAMLAAAALGGAADRLQRARLIIAADSFRALMLCSLPLLIFGRPWLLFPAVVLLGAIGALSQASREAAVPHILRADEIPGGNAVIAGATTAAQAIGYPLAAVILWATSSTTPMFIADGLTFAIAAALTFTAGGLGGGISSRRIGGAIRAAWSLPPVRTPLVIAGAAALIISMTLPALVVLAYQLANNGPRAYTVLEVVITVGMVVGAVVLGWWSKLPVRVATVIGLVIMGLLSLIVVVSPWLVLTSIALLLASIGNQIYVVGNRSEIQQAVPSDRRGSVMATRAVIAETLVIVGAGAGGILTGLIGGRATYAIVAGGLLILGLLVWARGARLGQPRPTIQMYPVIQQFELSDDLGRASSRPTLRTRAPATDTLGAGRRIAISSLTADTEEEPEELGA